MDRYVILLDAGYFFAAGAHAVQSRQVARRSISLTSPDATVKSLCERAAQITGVASLLRVYWYDAIQGPRPSLEQTTIANLPGVKLRLGSLNSLGEQKGVDSLIVTDLIELARNGALSDAVVISGDEDLRVAVQVSQTFGVRVHVLAVGEAVNNVSMSLQMEADSVNSLDVSWIKQHLTIKSDPAPQTSSVSEAKTVRASGQTAKPSPSPISPKASASVKPEVDLEQTALAVCKEIVDNIAPNDVQLLRTYFEANKTVPPEYDRKLIAKTGANIGRFLDQDEKRRVRGLFVTHVRKAAAQGKA